ncbi:arginine N-succinyltransferase [Neptunomonas phycophila]|uniref:arginine N-succinyltransferase n=1 Tax=Neptunomonas phycophila TaxID=1572645 RepID=UPI0026E18930|nr:arginine N-succinyltransferase [Neptunomonas phycophila]MDO6783518.1 arginine N-succinyltransferase [Neptunomonas phycophila]
MYLLRPCQTNDLAALLALSELTGAGMTSMPCDLEHWKQKIDESQQSFSATPARSGSYFMVLEDHATGEIVGTTAIYTGLALTHPFYAFRVSEQQRTHDALNICRSSQVLERVSEYTGATEIGSLFLAPDHRLPGLGQLLSRARFLLMADAPERFGDRIFAELRGWQNAQGHSPLWESLGQRFMGITFDQAVAYTAEAGLAFAEELLPDYPICIDLLAEEAQAVIGRPHDSSAPALAMLKREGFQWQGLIDLFDGGPHVESSLGHIQTVKHSTVSSVDIVPSDDDLPLNHQPTLISNTDVLNFRVTLAPAAALPNGQLVITQATADALLVTSHQGAVVRCVSLNRQQNHQQKTAIKAA